MKTILGKILFSTRLTATLFIVFAVSMAIGTFLDMGAETSPTPYSRSLIFNTWWFETIMGFFMINFAGNIFKYNLLRKEKWDTLILHLSFVIIIFGAFVTRYISYEGVMPIREGVSSNQFLSDKVYLSALVDGDYKINGELQRKTIFERLLLSEKLNNDFEISNDYNHQDFTIKYINYINDAVEELVPSATGKNYIKLVEAGEGERHDHHLEEGVVTNIHNRLFSFNNPTNGAINIIQNDAGELTISTPFEGTVMRMADQKQFTVVKDSIQPLKLRSLYNLENIQFVLPEPIVRGEFKTVKAKVASPKPEDALTIEVSTKNETKQVTLLGGKGFVNKHKTIELGGLEFHLNYGAKELELPFSIKLNDFIADKYPGNMKAFKAFKSKVTIEDTDGNFDYDIFMNNVLDHKGYRFFQAGFDPDEKGTILSVSHDFWGTWISYIGYGLLFLSMLTILFNRNTRFSDLRKQLTK